MALVEDCVFCKIIRGEVPCVRLYEDEAYLVFLDIAPFNFGHALIIPKDHHTSCTTLSPEQLAGMMQLAPKVAVALMRATKAEGFNLLLNNGRCSGQEVPHVHLHVVPRFVDDSMIFLPPKKKYQDIKAMQELAEKVKEKLAK